MLFIRKKHVATALILAGYLIIASGCSNYVSVKMWENELVQEKETAKIEGDKSIFYFVLGAVIDNTNVFAVDGRVVSYSSKDLSYFGRQEMNYTTELTSGDHDIMILSKRFSAVGGQLAAYSARSACKICKMNVNFVSGSKYKTVTDGVAIPFKEDVAQLINTDDSSIIGSCKLKEILCGSLDIEYYLLSKKGDSGPIGAQAQVP